jgi:hypothetical protein
LGSSELADAQGNRRNDDKQQRENNKRLEKANKEQAKAEQRRIRAEQERQAQWTRRNTQVWNGSNRANTTGVYEVNVNSNTNRYRVYRNGSYYQTDYRGAELLRHAVNEGYRQGFQAGRSDRGNLRNISWSNSNVYRTGSIGYQSYVTRSQYQYYFRQGFQRGYQDGSNSRYQDGYDGQYEFGSYQNGSLNILGTILNTVLNIRSY